MSMMYKIVAQALQENGLSNKYHPQDYLSFYCLGKREAPPLDQSQMNQQTENRALVYFFIYARTICMMGIAFHIQNDINMISLALPDLILMLYLGLHRSS